MAEHVLRNPEENELKQDLPINRRYISCLSLCTKKEPDDTIQVLF